MPLPKPKLTLTTSDKLIEVVCFLMLAGCWVYLGMNYGNLPNTIPSHYNIKGVADNFDDKSHLIELMVFFSALYLGLTIANFFPNRFNYLGEITAENAHSKYIIATGMMRVVKLIISLIFAYLLLKSLHNVQANQTNLDSWVMPVFLITITAASGHYIVKLARK